MKLEKLNSRDSLWMITRGPDGRLHDELDPRLIARLAAADSPEALTDALVISAGELVIAATRAW
jgi:hypothetical protein